MAKKRRPPKKKPVENYTDYELTVLDMIKDLRLQLNFLERQCKNGTNVSIYSLQRAIEHLEHYKLGGEIR